MPQLVKPDPQQAWESEEAHPLAERSGIDYQYLVPPSTPDSPVFGWLARTELERDAVSEALAAVKHLSDLESRVDRLRAELRAHLVDARRNREFLFEVAGLPQITPDQVDALAEDAYQLLLKEGVSDPIAFAERRHIDLRVADLAFRRLRQQDKIEEA